MPSSHLLGMLATIAILITLGAVLEGLARLKAHREARKLVKAVREGRDRG